MRLRATVGGERCAGKSLQAPPRRYAKGDRCVRCCYDDSAEAGTNSGRNQCFVSQGERRPHVMIAKLGQDGDRSAKVATAFADLGFDVDIGPLFQTPRMRPPGVENDVRRGHLDLPQAYGDADVSPCPSLKAQGADDIVVFVGGVIPAQDYEFLRRGRASGASMAPAPIPASARMYWEQIRKAVAWSCGLARWHCARRCCSATAAPY